MSEEVASGLVRGFLHRGSGTNGIVLAHGAGSDANARLLVALAVQFCEAGWTALRVDLPFRQLKPSGPPGRGSAEIDRQALGQACTLLRDAGCARVYLGGHSYGGRQGSMLAAENDTAAEALLLLSYPLHPPRKPEQLRTGHFGDLLTPALFVHGARDPFGSPDEMKAAISRLRSAELVVVDGAAHELKPVVQRPELAVDAFLRFVK